MRAVKVPRSRPMLTSSSAVTRFFAPPYTLLTRSSRTTGPAC
ncbi:hypothetical protein [Streptomyces sp. KL116D]